MRAFPASRRVLLVGALIAGSAMSLALPAQAQSYKLGLMVPVTGKAADAGKREAIGFYAALDVINASGGINGVKLEAAFADPAGAPQEAITALRKLTGEDQVLAIVGPHYSGVAEATFPLGNRLGITQISVASSKPGVSGANRPYAFRNTLTEDKIVDKVVSQLIAMHKVKKIAIITDMKDPVAKSLGLTLLPEAAAKAGLTIVNAKDPVTFQSGDAQFAAQITRLKALDADAIGLGALGPDALNIVIEARRQGMKQVFFGAAPLMEGDLPKKGGAALQGTLAGAIWDASINSDANRQFLKAYAERAKTLYVGEYTAVPDYYAVNSYDAVMMLAKAIKDGKVTGKDLAADRKSIMEQLTKMSSFDGVASAGYDKNGDGIKDVHVLEIRDGKWQLAK